MCDWDFRGKNNTRLNQSSDKQFNHVDLVNITWRFQKNNDNGQVINYTKNNKTPSSAMYEQQ